NETPVAGQNRLHLAVRSNSGLALQCLADDMDSLNARDANGCTPLFLAVKAIQKSLARSLIHAGADVNIADNEGHTPLWWVSLHDPIPDMARLLVGAGASRESKAMILAEIRNREFSH